MSVKIHKLFEYLLETSQKPEAVLGFSLTTPPTLSDYLAELNPKLSLDWSNESFQGLMALRAHVLRVTGLEQSNKPDDVLITAGAAEANFLAITQLLREADEIIVDTPGWPQALVLAEAKGVTIKRLRRKEENDWHFEMKELEQLISPNTRLIFICNPNNPTGQILQEDALKEVIRLADTVGAYLLCDEVYAGLEWESERIPSVAGLYERGISTGSVSKSLGLQGLRTGWLISQDAKLIRDALILRENSSEIMNVMGEHIAEIALRPERYEQAIANARAEAKTNLDMLDAFITSRPELSWQRPAAGLIGLCRLHLAMTGESFAKRLLERPYQTFVIPGIAYDCPQHLRLGVGGGKTVKLELGLERLARCLDDLSTRVQID
jgi:hypothetical protein